MPGIAPAEVDGLSSFTMETTDEVTLAKTIGAGDITYFSQVGYGGGAGCATIGHAAMAVATGQADVVVAWRSRKRGARTTRPWAAAPSRLPIQAQWTRPFGLLRPVDEVAMLARRYMHEYGGGREHLAEVAMAVRAHANRNPAALMYDKPMSLDDYMAARFISEPLCLFDNCLETDGALAAVIVSAERARDCPHPPALVHAFGQGLHRQHESMVNYYCDDPLTGPAWACARRSCGPSPRSAPTDIDVAQIYDAFTPLILLVARGLRLLQAGRGGRLRGRREPALGHGVAADQHVGRRAVRGLRPRVQPRHRGSAPAARDLDQPGRRGADLPRHLGRGRAHQRHRPAGGVTMSEPLEIRIDWDRCMGSGNCVFWAPDSFELGDDGHAVVIDPAATDEERLRVAAQGCPVGAITLWRDGAQVPLEEGP